MTKAVEPYTDEDWAAFKAQVDGGVGVMLTNGEARSILATIEADREKLAEKDARIAELEDRLSVESQAASQHVSARAQAEARVSELEKEREWQPIEDAPRDGTVVDLWAQERERYAYGRIADCQFLNGRWARPLTIYDTPTPDDMGNALNPTHYRKRPTPPEEEAK